MMDHLVITSPHFKVREAYENKGSKIHGKEITYRLHLALEAGTEIGMNVREIFEAVDFGDRALSSVKRYATNCGITRRPKAGYET